MSRYTAPVMDRNAFIGFNRREVAMQSECGRRNALLVYLIFFFMRNRDEKGVKRMKQDVICPYEY